MSYIDKLTQQFDPSNLSAFGTLETQELEPAVQLDFVYGINTQTGVSTVLNSATVDTNASRLRLQSGTNSAGSAIFNSRRIVKYRPGQGTTARYTCAFGTGTASNTQICGLGNSTDGYFFGYNGTSFGILHRNNGVETWIAQTSWNGDKANGTGASGFTINPQFGNVYMIKYPFLGYGDIEFFIEDSSSGRFILVHIIKYANTSTSVQLTNPNLHFYVQNLNAGNTTNVTMYVGSVGVFSSGRRLYSSSPQWAADSTKSGITTEAGILSIQNCTSYNGVTNRSLIRLNCISVSNSANSNATIRLKLGATLGGTPTFTAVSGTGGPATITNGNSVASVDTAATTVTGGTYLFNIQAGANSNNIIDLTQYELFIAPGETLTISGSASASSGLGVSINWKED